MSISKEEVKHVATLAKLSFKETELDVLEGEMNNILDLMEQLAQVDTTDVPVTSHGYPLTNVMRSDDEVRTDTREDLFRNLKYHEDGYIQVPDVMSTGEGGA